MDEDIKHPEMKDLLRVITGSEEIPILGFEPQPSIAFKHDADCPVWEKHWPRVSTCNNQITLHVTERYKVFVQHLVGCIWGQDNFNVA